MRTDKASVLTEEEKSPVKLDVAGFQRNNSDEKPFLCNFCDQRFSDSEKIISHMKEHESQEMLKRSARKSRGI